MTVEKGQFEFPFLFLKVLVETDTGRVYFFFPPFKTETLLKEVMRGSQTDNEKSLLKCDYWNLQNDSEKEPAPPP